MSLESNLRPRVGIPYRTRKEEVTGLSAKLAKYIEAVRQAGAEPVPISLLLPADELQGLAQTLDGVVLSGSPADVDPERFGASRQPECADPDLDRERTDFALLEHSFAEHKPVLAICFGIQSLNVFLGGTLIQDIPSQLGTQIEHEWDREGGAPEPFHAARIEPGSQLAHLAGASEEVVNSSHHQSVKDLGRGLRIAARAPDGVIEAVEWTGDAHWVMGVQWHPERMAGSDALAQQLFRGLVSAAATRKAPART
jgi:putative glutamine amidotransferase